MGFDTELLPAEAIREIRARGCTTPGVAELIVKHHGAQHVLLNLHRVEELGSELANSDTAEGAEMRARLAHASEEEVKAAEGTQAPAETLLEESSKPSESQAPPSSGEDGRGSASDAAGTASETQPAAGLSEPPAETVAADQGAASVDTGSQGEGQAQGS